MKKRIVATFTLVAFIIALGGLLVCVSCSRTGSTVTLYNYGGEKIESWGSASGL